MRHRWESLLFAHWRYPAGEIQRTLPAGLTVDTFDADAYVSIAPFFMRNVRAPFLPALPFTSNFLELNVRTYVFDESGRPGVWFFSLDCNNPLAVFGARAAYALPYFNAAMSATRGDWIDYRCQRRGVSDEARIRYRGVGEHAAAEPGSLEFWFVERYILFASRAGKLFRGHVAHRPYPLRRAEVSDMSVAPAQWDNLRAIGGAPDHLCYSDGVDVDIYGLRRA
jgi:uncharacterized protein YqjF (DUF2071 family)